MSYSAEYTDTASALLALYTSGDTGNAAGATPVASASTSGAIDHISSVSSGPYYTYTGTVDVAVTWVWDTGSGTWRATYDVGAVELTASAFIDTSSYGDFCGADGDEWWELVS